MTKESILIVAEEFKKLNPTDTSKAKKILLDNGFIIVEHSSKHYTKVKAYENESDKKYKDVFISREGDDAEDVWNQVTKGLIHYFTENY